MIALVRRAACAAVLLSLVVLVPAARAGAGEPTMGLDQARPGMQCTGRTVLRGSEISTFDVEVLDVVAGGGGAQILARAGGPSIADTGIGEGFSGSPVSCPGPDGTPAIIGAVAEGTGDYGNRLVLLTPIATLLGEPVDVPAARRRARELSTPLTFAGVSGPVAAALRTAGRKTGRMLLTAPAAPRAAAGAEAASPPVPGSSVAVGLAAGDIAAGAVGTVTYVDGDRVWAFGHPLDAAGRRSLLLQDAYVYTVVGNPIDTEDVTSYKLAAPGRIIGTLTNDAPAGVVGRLGAGPARFPLRVTATDTDSGRSVRQLTWIADENEVGLPTGTSSLTQVAPVAIAQAAYDALRGSPVRQSASMCLRVTVRERKKPLRFCNRYVGGAPSAPGAGPAADAATALSLLDTYNFGVLRVRRVDVNLKVRRGLHQAYLLGARAPKRVRRGRHIRVRLRAQHVRGGRFTRTVRVRVPRDLPLGERVLTLTGTPADTTGADGGDDQGLSDTFEVTFGDESDEDDTGGPRSVGALADAFADTHRDDGLTASFRSPADTDGEHATDDVVVLRDPALRFSGSAEVTLRVVRGR